jgi:hypothetical protein
MIAPHELDLANSGDLRDILDLQQRNLAPAGIPSARLSQAWFEAALAAMPVIVARRDRRLVGYLVSAPLAASADSPVIEAMLRAYRGAPTRMSKARSASQRASAGRVWP